MRTTPKHEITATEAHAVCAVLHAVEHIDVAVSVVDHVAHVHPARRSSTGPARPLSTGERVTALRAFAAVTDAVVWDGGAL